MGKNTGNIETQSMNYLVTGGGGFIGSHLVDALVDKGEKVIVIDNLFSGLKSNINNKAKFYKADIRDFKKIKPLFNYADVVFHLAAIPRVPLSVKDPIATSEVNIKGTIHVFQSAIEQGAKRIVFASSSAVYGDQRKLPLRESMKPVPQSPYGLQKLVGEQFAALFSSMHKIPIVSLRYFNVYGPRIDFDSEYGLVIGKFLKLSAQKKPLTIFGTGKQTRDFCYVEDVVEASILAAESKKLKGGEVINVGRGKSCTVNAISRLMSESVAYLPSRAGDVLHTKADIALAQKLLGWQPRTDLSKGISLTKAWFESENGLLF